jgi:hypothetical protein
VLREAAGRANERMTHQPFLRYRINICTINAFYEIVKYALSRQMGRSADAALLQLFTRRTGPLLGWHNKRGILPRRRPALASPVTESGDRITIDSILFRHTERMPPNDVERQQIDARPNYRDSPCALP